MGYGYGVWLIYEHQSLKTEHISHVTVACFMNKKDAFELRNQIYHEIGGENSKFILLEIQRYTVVIFMKTIKMVLMHGDILSKWITKHGWKL